MNMKKYTLRDEYDAPSRDELKAFADEFNNQGEAKRAKGANAEKARKTGKGFARAKIYNILDNGKFEGHIYDRTEDLNISKEDNDDIRMMTHAGRFDGFNGASKESTNDAPAYIKPTMIEFNGNAKPLDEINPEIETIMTNEYISKGKWNGKQTTTEIYNNIQNMNTLKTIKELEFDNQSPFYMAKSKGKKIGLFLKPTNIIAGDNKKQPQGLNTNKKTKDNTIGTNNRIYKKIYIYNANEHEKRTLKESKEYETYIRNHTEGCIEKITGTRTEEYERQLYRNDRNTIIKEDMKGIMKAKDEAKKAIKTQHSYDPILPYTNKYINEDGKYNKEGKELFSINQIHEARSGREEARINMKARNNNMGKNKKGKYYSTIKNKWISY